MRKLATLMLALTTLGGCSLFSDSHSQYTNKLEAPAFTSELYGTQSHVLAVTQPAEGHISWIGFVQSNDYKYFKLTKLQSGSTVIRSEGKSFVDASGDEQTFTPSSSTIVEDITVGATADSSTSYTDGSITIAGGSDLKLTVEYSPTIAIDNDTSPHEAYLIIYYDAPTEGSARIKLTGYTQGVKDEKCAQDPATMDVVTYKFVDDKLDFYFCGSQVKIKDQANMDPESADYRNDSTNLTEISTLNTDTGESQGVTFYQVDDETVCLLSEKLTGDVASVPDFRFIVPSGLGVPVAYLDIAMVEGSYAQCDLSTDGIITCPDNIQIDTLISLSGLKLTNGTITSEETTTTECTGFGEMTGSGKFKENEMTFVLKGTVLSDSETENYQIVDSLVAAEIKLECSSGC